MTGASDPHAAAGTGTLVVLATMPAAEPGRLARALAEEHLARLVNEFPGVRSTFDWQRGAESGEQSYYLIRTTGNGCAALDRIHDVHASRFPELSALPVAAGSGPYLEWLRQSVTAA